MKITALTPTTPIDYNKKTTTTFKATPQQILRQLETARICPPKRFFLAGIADFFETLQNEASYILNTPFSFKYYFGENNKLPNMIKEIDANGKTLEQLDQTLSSQVFMCPKKLEAMKAKFTPEQQKAACSCDPTITKGKIVKKLLEAINVENPEFIEISKK